MVYDEEIDAIAIDLMRRKEEVVVVNALMRKRREERERENIRRRRGNLKACGDGAIGGKNGPKLVVFKRLTVR